LSISNCYNSYINDKESSCFKGGTGEHVPRAHTTLALVFSHSHYVIILTLVSSIKGLVRCSGLYIIFLQDWLDLITAISLTNQYSWVPNQCSWVAYQSSWVPDQCFGVPNQCFGFLTSVLGFLTSVSGFLTSVSGFLTSVSGSLTRVPGSLTSVHGFLTSVSGFLTSVLGFLTSVSGFLTSVLGFLTSVSGFLTSVPNKCFWVPNQCFWVPIQCSWFHHNQPLYSASHWGFLTWSCLQGGTTEPNLAQCVYLSSQRKSAAPSGPQTLYGEEIYINMKFLFPFIDIY